MEIEIKALCKDKEKVKAHLKKIGAQMKGQKHQIDEYYNHPSRDTRTTKEYIRLRYKPQENKGIFAYHLNIRDGVTKEFEVEVNNLETFKDILKNLNFKLLGVIDKERESYTFEKFSITIDAVKNIGTFVEIETEGEENEADEKQNACVALLEKIGLTKHDLCQNVWLADIATGKTIWKP
jgi:adenylate cyclase class 2